MRRRILVGSVLLSVIPAIFIGYSDESSKDIAVIRASSGGEPVVSTGDAPATPSLYRIMPLNVSGFRLDVGPSETRGNATKSHMYVDLEGLFEEEFLDAPRSVVAEMPLELRLPSEETRSINCNRS